MRTDGFFARFRMAFFLIAAISAAVAIATGSALAGPTTTTLTTGTPDPSTFGETVTFTATVKGGAPTGTVTILDGATELGSGPLSLLGTGTSLALGDIHTCALSAAGGAKCWGFNANGQLGNGSFTESHVPVDVSGLATGVAAIAGGGYHNCALTAAGGARCWGLNFYGQLGDDSTANRPTPVDVVGLASGVAAIAGGGFHTCALTTAGGVNCWGWNSHGQLGDNSITERHTPVDVVGLTSGVVAVVAGAEHTCALTTAGGVKCWGYNNRGQLGDNTTTERHTPVDVVGLTSGVAAIAAGVEHTCALTTAGGVKCWGYNNRGQLGDNSTSDRHTHVDVVGLSSGVVAIAPGGFFTCALTAASSAMCWGANDWGQLGDNSTSDRHTPVDVVGFGSVFVAIATGSLHTCAVTPAGAAGCWGANGNGELGDNSTSASDIPVPVVGLGNGTVLVPAEATFSTAALQAGSRSITARYDGDSLNDASTSAAVTQVVEKGATRTRIKVRPRNPSAGDTVRLLARVRALAPATGLPAGKVLVRDGRRKIGTFKVRKGKAGVRLGALSAGTHSLKIIYRGSRNWGGSKAAAKVVVRP